MRIRAAIAEDEEEQIEQLLSYFRRMESEGDTFQVEVFRDGADLLVDFLPGKYDVIFLDIQMDHMSGMEAAERIREEDSRVLLVFVSNLVHYAVQGYSVKAWDFIVKPLSYEVFARKIADIRKVLEKHRKASLLFRTVNGGMVNLERDEILFVELTARKLFVHTRDEVFQCNMTLQEVCEKLADSRFFRCHASILVNLAAIRAVEKDTVRVGDKNLPVSRHRRKELLNALTMYLSGEV